MHSAENAIRAARTHKRARRKFASRAERKTFARSRGALRLRSDPGPASFAVWRCAQTEAPGTERAGPDQSVSATDAPINAVPLSRAPGRLTLNVEPGPGIAEAHIRPS